MCRDGRTEFRGIPESSMKRLMLATNDILNGGSASVCESGTEYKERVTVDKLTNWLQAKINGEGFSAMCRKCGKQVVRQLRIWRVDAKCLRN